MSKRKGSGLFYGWAIVGVCFLTFLAISGARFSFGASFKPMLLDFDTNRGMISLAMSLNQIFYGFASPLVGWLSDRYGARTVIILSGLLAAVGLLVTSLAPNLWVLYVAYGVVVGVAFTGTTTIPFSSLLTRWFRRNSGLALGIATVGTPTGHLILVPLLMYVILWLGWRSSYAIMAGMVAVLIVPLAWRFLKADPRDLGLLPDGDAQESHGPGVNATVEASGSIRADQNLAQAARTRSFWLLSLGWFTCGFTGFLVAAHLVPFATDMGMGEMEAATALALQGGASIPGTFLVSALSDRVGRKNPLAAVYFSRFLAYPLIMTPLVLTNHTLIYLFSIIIGFGMLATLAPASALVREVYGQRSMGIILGTILLVHQVGAGLGVYLGGAIFDATGSYYWSFMIAALLALLAAVGSYLIKEERVPRYQEVAAAAS